MYFTIIYYKMIKLYYQHNDYNKINVIVLKH